MRCADAWILFKQIDYCQVRLPNQIVELYLEIQKLQLGSDWQGSARNHNGTCKRYCGCTLHKPAGESIKPFIMKPSKMFFCCYVHRFPFNFIKTYQRILLMRENCTTNKNNITIERHHEQHKL